MPKFRKQTWIETEEYIQITLHQPFWSAWKMYGWEAEYGKTEGLGISHEAVKYAFKVDKKIRIVVLTYGKWEISPHMALRRAKEYNSHFRARDGKDLVIIPRLACTKIEKSEVQKREEDAKEKLRLNSIHKAENLRLV